MARKLKLLLNYLIRHVQRLVKILENFAKGNLVALIFIDASKGSSLKEVIMKMEMAVEVKVYGESILKMRVLLICIMKRDW